MLWYKGRNDTVVNVSITDIFKKYLVYYSRHINAQWVL